MLKRWFLVGIIELCLVAWCGVWGVRYISAVCNGVEILKWTDDYRSVDNNNVTIINGLTTGESVCTILPNLNGWYVDGVANCTDNGIKYLSPYEMGYGNSPINDQSFFCEDSRDGNNFRKALIKNGEQCSYTYENQGFKNEILEFNPREFMITLSGETVCKDKNIIGMCNVRGEIVPVKQCLNGQMCKIIGTWQAECKNPECTENGVTVNNGEFACIPENPDDPNSKIWLKKCIIGEYNEGQECSGGCGLSSLGVNECNDKESGDVTCYDSNISKDTYKSGAKLCFENTVYTCGEDGKFNPAEKPCTDKEPCTPVVKESDGTIIDVRCQDPSKLGDDEKMLNISVTTSNGFWCKEGDSINTALGCIPITAQGLVDNLLPTLFGLAGVLSFLMMVFGFIMVATSSGDEKKLQEAKQRITSAIIGLLLSIFALVIYRMIAVNILQIPGIK